MTFEELTAPYRKPAPESSIRATFDWRKMYNNNLTKPNIVGLPTIDAAGDSQHHQYHHRNVYNPHQRHNPNLQEHAHRSHSPQLQRQLNFRMPRNVNVKDNYLVQALSQTTLAFCQETTLHGMKYVVQDIQELGSTFSRQRRLRKLISLSFWSVACVMGAVFAIVLMGLVWDRFQTTPTITTVETNNYPIWNVPFPAVTVCNINKVYAPAARNITDKL